MPPASPGNPREISPADGLKPPVRTADSSGMATRDASKADAYLRNRVMTASPEQLRLMLLDGAIKFGSQGLEGMRASDFEAVYDGVSQCRAIVAELLSSIRDDVDPELAHRARSVYGFMFRELMELGIERDAKRMAKVLELLEYERETWVLLMEKLAKEGSTRTPAPAGEERPSISLQA
ncbi:MAG: flagellar export chaperone FliS [Phycisphaerales bacterium JB037]